MSKFEHADVNNAANGCTWSQNLFVDLSKSLLLDFFPKKDDFKSLPGNVLGGNLLFHIPKFSLFSMN